MIHLLITVLAIAPPLSDGLPPPKAVIAKKTTAGPCKCPCGSPICRCADMGGCLKPAAKSASATSRRPVYRTETRRVCNGGRCSFQTIQVFDHWEQVAEYKPLATADAAHTPLSEVNRVLNLLPEPETAFVDFGCGFDARWCVAAAEKWKCRVTGIEIDHDRAAAARDRVRNLGLDHLITIVEGDALTTDVQGDVAVVYLYPKLLARLKPKLEKFRAMASYMHAVPGLPMQRYGDSFIYRKAAVSSAPSQQTAHRRAVWGGMAYGGPVCNSPNCAMCRSIRHQLGQ